MTTQLATPFVRGSDAAGAPRPARLAGTTTREIAKAAGVSKGHLNHFADKYDLCSRS